MKSQSDFVELVLTCGSWQEAQTIADALLEERLVACVEMMEVKSKYWWQRQLEEAIEVKLIMQSIEDNFAKVEAMVKKLHSYQTPSLLAIPIVKVSKDTAQWLNEITLPNTKKGISI